MKITGRKSISNYIKILLQVIFVFGILVIAFLPIIVKYYIQILRLDLLEFYFPCLALLYASGIPMLVVVKQFIDLFNTLSINNPFVIENVKHLKIASVCSGVIALEYVIGIYVFKSIFTLIIVGIFLIAWIGLYILSELFQQAVQFKEENDLTI